MEARWRQPTTLKGLSRFLVEHEPCGAGFDVSHPAGLGSGRVSMTCRGCGATYEYATATIEFEREVEFEPVRVPARAENEPVPATPPGATFVAQPEAPRIEPPKAEPEPAAEPPKPPATPKKPKARRDRQLQLPKSWTRDRRITAGLLLFSAAALIFAVIRISGDSGESTSQQETSPPAATSPPAQTNPTNPTTPQKSSSAPKSKSAKTPATPQKPSPVKPGTGERVVKTDRFSVVVPSDWTRRAAPGGGTLLAPPGSAQVSLQVFYENDPGLSLGKMSAQTASFLSSRDPGAAVSPTKRLRVAGNPAFEISASGPAGSQSALGVVAGPYRYLAIASADPGTPGSLKAATQRALKSFEPH
jgi:hypothetical protein